MILLTALALADEPLAITCDKPLEEYAEIVRKGSPEAYDCLRAEDGSGAILLAAAAAGGDHPERVTRALAVWRLDRLDAVIPAEEARTYSAADRRLLMDGIRAHRGRKSPSPEQEAVLTKFDWYKPDPAYIEGRLTQQDKANIQMLDAPPAEVKEAPPSAADAMPAEAAAPAAPAAPKKGCGGCQGAPGALAGLPLALAALWRRRR